MPAVRDALLVHTLAHLKFFARSRLLLGLALVLGGVWALGLVAFVVLESWGDRFETLKTIASQLRMFAWFYTAAMGLFALWWHTTQRATSVVFTRPCRPEIWLASVFTSALLVALVIHGAGFVLTLCLSLAWGIPFQAGFLWLALDGLLESIIIVSVLTGLSAVIHPALAILAIVFFSESTFFYFDTMLLGYIDARGASIWASAGEGLMKGIYLALPMLDPFHTNTREVEMTLRVSSAAWKQLGLTASYALFAFTFWFLFAARRLRRRAPGS